jgi:hypothetical protein
VAIHCCNVLKPQLDAPLQLPPYTAHHGYGSYGAACTDDEHASMTSSRRSDARIEKPPAQGNP